MKQGEHIPREVRCIPAYKIICTCGWEGHPQLRMRYAGDDFDQHIERCKRESETQRALETCGY